MLGANDFVASRFDRRSYILWQRAADQVGSRAGQFHLRPWLSQVRSDPPSGNIKVPARALCLNAIENVDQGVPSHPANLFNPTHGRTYNLSIFRATVRHGVFACPESAVSRVGRHASLRGPLSGTLAESDRLVASSIVSCFLAHRYRQELSPTGPPLNRNRMVSKHALVHSHPNRFRSDVQQSGAARRRRPGDLMSGPYCAIVHETQRKHCFKDARWAPGPASDFTGTAVIHILVENPGRAFGDMFEFGGIVISPTDREPEARP